MIYQNYYLAESPTFVFQKRGKTWYKRKKGSSDKWLVAPFNEQSALQHNFGERFLFKYNTFFKVALLAGIVYSGYKGYTYWKKN